MTTDEIIDRIVRIRNISDDAEAAHASEDKLHLEFIKYVATLGDHLPALAVKAKLVASTEDIEFSRWCG